MAEHPQYTVQFLDSGREPKCPPNPDYPEGIFVDSGERPACRMDLPYPAPRCGAMVVACTRCGVKVALTVAGRPDDPHAVMVPCKTIQ